jgi:hypothetical protein
MTSASGPPYLPLADVLTSTEPPVTWLIPDLIPQGTLIVLAGEANIGKSFLSYSLGLALASGLSLLDWHIAARPHRVLYFDNENSKPDSTQYLRWVWHALGCPDPQALEQALKFVHFRLGTSDWLATADQYVQDCQPELIIFDTATPCCALNDENDNAEASRTINKLRWLMTRTTPPAACLVLKHTKILAEGATHTIRGAKGWLNMTDQLIFHLGVKGRPSRALAADRLKQTRLVPEKVRAFGFKQELLITPSFTPDRLGLVLHSAPVLPD